MTTVASRWLKADMLRMEINMLLKRYSKVGIKTHYSGYELTIVDSTLYSLKKISNNAGAIDPGEEFVGNDWRFDTHEDHLHLLLFTGNGRLLTRTSRVEGFAVSFADIF